MVKVGRPKTSPALCSRNSRQTPSLWATQLSYKHLHIYHQFPSIWNHLKLYMGFIYHDLGLILPSFTIIYHHFNGFFPSFPMIFARKKRPLRRPWLGRAGHWRCVWGAQGGGFLATQQCQWIMDISRDVNKKTGDYPIIHLRIWQMGIIQLSG